jgi:hypothetical protein
MKIDNALLCEAATVRDGLLFILGGGITVTGRPEFPSPLQMTLAVRVVMHREEISGQHELEIVLNDEDGASVVRVKVGFGLLDPEVVPVGEEVAMPIPWNFPGRPLIPHAGRYSFELLIDGIHLKSVPFTAALDTGEQPQ